MTEPLSSAFFASVRASLFGGALSPAQVDGLKAIALAFNKHGDGDVRKFAYCLATGFHETGGEFGPKIENLNYTSASRIRAVWPTRFTLATALDYVRNPQKLANKVYGGRLGNTRVGDGWLFRGRGPAQPTGRGMYAKMGDLLDVDLEGNPERALDADIGASILVLGLVRGLFTGRALANGVPDWVEARATINADKNTKSANGQTFGRLIGGYADKFEAALKLVDAPAEVKPAKAAARSPIAIIVGLVVAGATGLYAFAKSQGWLP